jgi:ATP-dependent 26S proteasome regulatory subunit
LPAIIFIDELDSIAGRREDAVKDMEVRIVA